MTRKRIFACVLVLGLICLCVYVLQPPNIKNIPFLNGVRFGMSPKQVTKCLGDYSEVCDDSGGTGKTAYTYQTEVLGHDAEVICYFHANKNLTEVSVRWNGNDRTILDSVYADLQNYYSSHKDFFVKDESDSDQDRRRISIGIDNGATGLFYDILAADEFISVWCVDNS